MSKIDAAKFVFSCRNWPELLVPIAMHKTPARAVLRNGLRFESPFIYWPDIYGIFFQQMYTPPFLPIEPDDFVVDIGANIGAFSIYAATQTRSAVHAFEPFPANCAAIRQNVALNKKGNIIVHQCALSDTIGIERFACQPDGVGHLQKVTASNDVSIEVPGTTLEAFMDEQRLERIDFLKMDCEGSEGLILPSAPLGRIRKIAMEFHDGRSPLKHPQIQALLQDAGFSTNLDWDGVSKLGLLYAWR